MTLQQVRFLPKYEDQKLVDLEMSVADRGLVALDPAGRSLREIAYDEKDGRKVVAAAVGDDEVLVYRTDDEGAERRETLKTKDGEKITRSALGARRP